MSCMRGSLLVCIGSPGLPWLMGHAAMTGDRTSRCAAPCRYRPMLAGLPGRFISSQLTECGESARSDTGEGDTPPPPSVERMAVGGVIKLWDMSDSLCDSFVRPGAHVPARPYVCAYGVKPGLPHSPTLGSSS